MSSVAFIKVSRRTKIRFSPDNTTRERGTSRQRSQKVSCRKPLRHTTFTGLPDATTSSHVVGWATSLLSPALTSQCYRLDCA
uniref:Uncharacterized protein n=1 Tax=Oryza glumipatula TaxID=40148 RepID=A0A0D9Z5E3_9ORYZ